MENQTKYCNECGVQIPANTKFCRNCGAPKQAASPRAAAAPLNVDRVLITANGSNGQLELLPNRVRIKRQGLRALATQGIKGDKEILISQVSSIQFKEAGALAGYIKFSFLGGQETKQGIFGELHDENTVTFFRNQQPAFAAIKKAVEQRRQEMQASSSQPMQQQIPNDIPSQIQKLSQLKEQGILTEEEFNQKKRELLARM
jgi:hypothetical protein